MERGEDTADRESLPDGGQGELWWSRGPPLPNPNSLPFPTRSPVTRCYISLPLRVTVTIPNI